MVTRNGRPDRVVTVTLPCSERWDVDLAVDVEIEGDGCACVVGARFTEGGLPLDPESLTETDDRRARELATEE